VSRPTAVPDDVAAPLSRLFSTIRSAGMVSAYLFGSHATGRARRDGDVDVVVLLDRAVYPDAERRFDERVGLSAWLVAELKTSLVDVVVLNDVPPGLAARIVTEGMAVHSASPELDHAFRRDALLRAADPEPFLRRTRRLKLLALAR
jgi:uncharacterized protein